MARNKRMGAAARRRWLAFGGLLTGLGLVAGWWVAGKWTPARERFPVQGVELAAHDGAVNFAALKAADADFVYLRATSGTQRDPAFVEALDKARGAGLQAGAIHRYDPCKDAGAQAGAFVTVVPRDAALLPPAVELELDEATCAAPPAEGAMASELTTFLNQVEGHAGKAALLKLSKPFETRYHLAAMIDRNLWVTGAYLAPGYPGRPWVMWTANPRLRSPASGERLRWVVVRP